ncbi:MAG: PD-(D/E)XK nuclease family protein [Bacillota bacterium]
MPVAKLDNFYFSQTALKTYLNCPMAFRRRYIDRLIWPPDYNQNHEKQELIEIGRRFHVLASRYFLGIGKQEYQQIRPENKKRLNSLKEYLPIKQGIRYLPEHELRNQENGIRLMAKYDLLYIKPQSGEVIIYDWKTGREMPDYNKFSEDLQTELYLFLFSQAGDKYYPERFKIDNLKMIYWNPDYPTEEVKVTYSSGDFRQAEQYLTGLVKEILSLDYEEYADRKNEESCIYCEYRPICKGQTAESSPVFEEDLELELDWEMLEEIKIYQ